MHSQLLPTIAPPPGNEDEGGDGFSEKINLDLGIGSCACGNEGGLKMNVEIKLEKKQPFFSAEQFQEFYRQIFICNSISCGLAVPFHLLLPIWMNVYNFFGPAIYNKYPSFIGFCPQGSDHTSMLDPDPGRCRRTDGRKWRCSKCAVQNQKYCERHMHRGRQRPRKHCQPIESVSRSDNKICDDSRIAITMEGDLGPSQPYPHCSNGGPAILRHRREKYSDGSLAIRATADAHTRGDEVNKNVNVDDATMNTSARSMNSGTADGGNLTEGEGSSFVNARPRKITDKKHNVAKNNFMGFVSPRFGLSPKSVLHSDAGNGSPSLSSKNFIETAPKRCRRTDGKKWQCRRDAISNEKYCEVHMHRGVKRLVLNPESASNTPATSTRRGHVSYTIAASLNNSINLNTMPTNPQHVTDNDSTSSSSDATTITDENISFCLNRPLQTSKFM